MLYTDAFVKYSKELGSPKYSPITAEQEKELFVLYKQGSEDAFQKIINSNLRFVPFLINKDFTIPNDVDIMDVIQEGNLGLIEGVKRFNYLKYNCRIYSYCSYWIYFYINVSLNLVQKKKLIFFSYDDLEENQKNDIIISKPTENLTEEICNSIINSTFDGLQDREKIILISYFGLSFPFTPKTLQEIGSMLHINLERVRQLKDRAVIKIKNKIIENFT